MASTKTSTEAMDRMIKNITLFLENQKVLMRALERDYARVGDEWKDKKYEQLGGTIREAVSSISNSSVTLSECVTKIQLLKAKLEEYLSTSI